MDIHYDVPFYSNTEDDTHCFQAALKMVLKYFQPKKEFSWQELEEITDKQEGLWTWPLASMLWLKKQGYSVQSLEVFDYTRFITEKEKYLLELYGLEGGTAQIQHSNIEQEIKHAQELVEANIVKKTLPTFRTIENSLKDGALLLSLLNSAVLNEKTGYIGHYVVIIGINNNELILHDPGLPPLENRSVSFDLFEKAWGYPDENAKNLIAIKK